MQAILRFFPGLVGAGVAFAILKLFSWREAGFELGAFLATYVVVALLVERGMQRYGRGSQ